MIAAILYGNTKNGEASHRSRNERMHIKNPAADTPPDFHQATTTSFYKS